MEINSWRKIKENFYADIKSIQWGILIVGILIGMVLLILGEHVGYKHRLKRAKLKPEQIEQLYNNGKGFEYSFHGNYDTCVVNSVIWIIPESVTVEFLK